MASATYSASAVASRSSKNFSAVPAALVATRFFPMRFILWYTTPPASSRIFLVARRRGHRGLTLPAVLRRAYPAEQPARGKSTVVPAKLRQRQFHRCKLVFIVIDRKAPRKPDSRRLAPQQPCAKGMKRSDPGISRRQPFADEQRSDPLLHLLGSLVGERHGKDGLPGHAGGDQMGDAVREGPRFPRARPRKDQQRSLGGFHGLTLLLVQIAQEIHGVRGPRSAANRQGINSN